MKNIQYQTSRTIKDLYEKKRRGVTDVIWKFTSRETLEEIQRNFRTEEWIYTVKTRTFSKIDNRKAILKSLHYDRLRGKKYRNCRLRREDKRILKQNDVDFKPLK